MNYTEQALLFDCAGDTLVGVLARPPMSSPIGVVVIVGGPQYRAGSHRQFVLLARHLAGEGIPCVRFDYRGMGDSEGQMRSFEDVSEDIRAAIDVFQQQCPDVKQVVLWGLCDAATAAALYAYTDKRVAGLVMLNPWVRTEAGEAKVYLKNYYWDRVRDKTFWSKLSKGKLDIKASLESLIAIVAKTTNRTSTSMRRKKTSVPDIDPSSPLPERLGAGLGRFAGPVLFILSGKDYTADEFRAASGTSVTLKEGMEKCSVSSETLPDANHTFSSLIWRNQVNAMTATWLKKTMFIKESIN